MTFLSRYGGQRPIVIFFSRRHAKGAKVRLTTVFEAAAAVAAIYAALKKSEHHNVRKEGRERGYERARRQ